MSLHLTGPSFPDRAKIIRELAQIRPFGGASLIMADPPWLLRDFGPGGDKSKTTSAQYDCQSIEWIEQLPVHAIAGENCLLWLWATAPMLTQAFGVSEAWGFTYKTSGVWVKRSSRGGISFGMGRRLRSSHEPFLIATKGKPRVSKAPRSVLLTDDEPDADPFDSIAVTIEAIAREHSRKPDEAFPAARSMVDGPAVELFSRQPREGWVTWGNQTEHFKGETV